ncbi:tRNA dihydrouridine synthase [Malassezia pachydermatis]
MSSFTKDVYPDLETFPPTGSPKFEKLQGYELYKHIGSPRHIVAPMVDQSELAWRILSRRYGSDLVYSPMINAKIYNQHNRGAHRVREAYFNQELGEEGAHTINLGDKKDTDRPLIVQVSPLRSDSSFVPMIQKCYCKVHLLSKINAMPWT